MATTTGGTTESRAEQAGDSTSLEWLARGGLIAYGVVHLLVGWLALQIAWGTSGGTSADTSGALTTLAQQPFGTVLLWVVAVGLLALALWQTSEAVWGHPDRDRGKRVRKQITSGAKAVVYAALAVSAALVALGSGSSSSQSQEQATTGVLAWPGGRVLVVAAGLVVIGAGDADTDDDQAGSDDEHPATGPGEHPCGGLLLGLRARRSRAERHQRRADRERGVDHCLGPAGGLLADALPAVPVGVSPDGFAGLPERECQQADGDHPQQDRAEGLLGQCGQCSGGVGAGAAGCAPGDLQGQPADQEVDHAVGDQPAAGEPFQ